MTVLQVGFFEDVKIRDYDSGLESPSSVVAREIAEGSPNDRVPSRDFMGYTKEKHSQEWVSFVANELKKQKGKFNLEDIWKKLSVEVVHSIRESMHEASAFAPLAKNTEKARKKAGITSENPFIATGGLYKSVEGRITDAPSQ